MRAIKYFHMQGIVHRDLKMDNIMLVNVNKPDELRVKLIDFGMSKKI